MLTVNDLKQKGYQVWVRHYRRKNINRNVSPPVEEIAQYGGYTIVRLKDEYQEEVGVAFCSKKDKFNKKLGLRIALGRASKTMGLPTK
jgi:AraC-like DNA-binding protein